MKLLLSEKMDEKLDALILLVDESLSIPEELPETMKKDVEMLVSTLSEKTLFSGKIGEQKSSLLKSKDQFIQLSLVGLGSYESFKTAKLQKSLAEAFKEVKKQNSKAVNVFGRGLTQYMDSIRKRSILMAETLVLADYEFTLYKSEAKPSQLERATLIGDFDNESIEEGILLSEATIRARELVNIPANDLTPMALGNKVKEIGEKFGFDVEIKKREEIESLGMKAYLAVSQASDNEPALIVMRYTGAPDSDRRLGYVGKGLTYDSGGLSIKPTTGMVTMKDDMGGAAAVIGAMSAIAEAKLKINVTAVVAACENMISGRSYKPGDIFETMAGKTIFIGNTDAEGRLTLVDAIHYIIQHEEVSAVIDIATLTGAAVHALGTEATCAVSNNDDYYELIEKGFSKANENIWRFPMFDEYKEQLKHHEADYTNMTGQPGMITAGMLLGEFVMDKPWVHLDIAGTAFKEKATGIFNKGGTGVGVRPLYYVAKKLSSK